MSTQPTGITQEQYHELCRLAAQWVATERSFFVRHASEEQPTAEDVVAAQNDFTRHAASLINFSGGAS